MYFRIRKEGLLWNHKRIHRVYKYLKLNLKEKVKEGYRHGFFNLWKLLVISMQAGRWIL